MFYLKAYQQKLPVQILWQVTKWCVPVNVRGLTSKSATPKEVFPESAQ